MPAPHLILNSDRIVDLQKGIIVPALMHPVPDGTVTRPSGH